MSLCGWKLAWWLRVVLSPDCFNLAGAVRAIDDATDLDVQDAVWMPGHQVEEDCLSTWGDTFLGLKRILWPLDWVWLCLSGVLAVGILLWMPSALRVDGVGSGFQDANLKPCAWYRAVVQSLTSHAAGIVAFCGFQYLVVTKILMTSDPCEPFSLPNILLCVTLFLSTIAVFASGLFLCVDYLRRLAILTAQQKGCRLTLEARVMEKTGLGRAILVLTGLMTLLYFLEISREAYYDEKDDVLWYLGVLLQSAGGCGTVALSYTNLRALHRSPKVPYDSACRRARQDKTLEEFLQEQSGQTASWLPAWVVKGLQSFGGDDLALVAAHGSRQAFFPQERFLPLLHVLAALLLIGCFPLGVYVVMGQLFVAPRLNDLKGLTGSLTEVSYFDQSDASGWQLLGSSNSSGGSVVRQFVLLMDANTEKIQVTPQYQRVSSLRLCCGSCSTQKLNHSLVKFHDKPVQFDVKRGTSKTCTLSLLGLSSGVMTNVSFYLAPKKDLHLCDCQGRVCKCCEGYRGEWDFREWNDTTFAKLDGKLCVGAPCVGEKLNGLPGPECQCKDSYFGQPKLIGHAYTDAGCNAAPCNLANSNQLPGTRCACASGFVGNISWNGATPSGYCSPAECRVVNSTQAPGHQCRCSNGFNGSITWDGPEATGNCTAARCDVPHSNKEPGLSCECGDKYVGQISWSGSTALGTCEPAPCRGQKLNSLPGPDCQCTDGYTGQPTKHGDSLMDDGCEAAPCNIPNTTGDGPHCRCKDGFQGEINWEGVVPTGHCKPAPCKVLNSNQMPGLECACLRGTVGNISWDRMRAFGPCKNIKCSGAYMNGVEGPDCRCADGYYGNLFPSALYIDPEGKEFGPHEWKGACTPARCTVENSNGVPGLLCQCRSGYAGDIFWNGSVSQGNCTPALCSIPNSNKEKGLDCKCTSGYIGHITWSGRVPSGTCRAAPCRVPQSDFAAGPQCRCLPGFYGQISWEEEAAKGECLPLPQCSSKLIHTTWLKTQLEDLEGHLCDAGQRLVFHGRQCAEEAHKIQWTLVESQPDGRCRWKLSGKEGHACGLDHSNDKIHQLFSSVAPAPPLECSIQVALPRCDLQFQYAITSHKASSYACRGEVGNMSPAPPQAPQALQFRGRLCGYDLIQWEKVSIWKHSGENQSLALEACELKGSHDAPLSCGEIPHGEHLPHGCLHLQEPAVFTLQHSDFSYSMKLFESGMSIVRRLGHEGAGRSSYGTHGWYTDGNHLSLRMPAMFEDGAEFFLVADGDDGSEFMSPDEELELKLLTSHTLPLWWTSALQADASSERAAHQIDSLWQCELSHYERGTCYHAKIGRGVMIWNTSESMCQGDFDHVGQDVKDKGSYYTFARSGHGTQTYANTQECLPFARRRELQVEIGELHGDAQPGALALANMETPCRITLRFVSNAAVLAKCKEKADAEWDVHTEDESINQIESMFDFDDDEEEEED